MLTKRDLHSAASVRCSLGVRGEDSRNRLWAYAFLYSAGAAFLLIGLAKVVAASGHAQSLDVLDPVFSIEFRYLMLLAGIIESVTALWLLLATKTLNSGLLVVAGLATGLSVYRLCLWMLHWGLPCKCLGSLTDALHLSPKTADRLALVVLAYMAIGAYGFLLVAHIRALRPRHSCKTWQDK